MTECTRGASSQEGSQGSAPPSPTRMAELTRLRRDNAALQSVLGRTTSLLRQELRPAESWPERGVADMGATATVHSAAPPSRPQAFSVVLRKTRANGLGLICGGDSSVIGFRGRTTAVPLGATLAAVDGVALRALAGGGQHPMDRLAEIVDRIPEGEAVEVEFTVSPRQRLNASSSPPARRRSSPFRGQSPPHRGPSPVVWQELALRDADRAAAAKQLRRAGPHFGQIELTPLLLQKIDARIGAVHPQALVRAEVLHSTPNDISEQPHVVVSLY